ncbi:hypothetical protein LCGC14_0723340 [marine sediment metagenome]|uniref:Uncharacterized protein n=1 Tax=marine sediment metagenome TaxID=412755 RepID=A0A0F9TJ35_9ZZZZ
MSAQTPISACRGASGLGDGVDQAIWLQRVVENDKADPGRTIWAEGRYIEAPDRKVGIVRTAAPMSGQYVPSPVGGDLGAQTFPPWLWTYSTPEKREESEPVAPVLFIVPKNTQTYTAQELAAIWSCSRRTVLRRLEGLPHERVGAGTASRPYRYVFPEAGDVPPEGRGGPGKG